MSGAVVRSVDPLGRVAIPKDIRVALGLTRGSQVEVLVDGDCIVLRPYRPVCVRCGGNDGLVRVGGELICWPCLSGLYAEAKARREAQGGDAHGDGTVAGGSPGR